MILLQGLPYRMGVTGLSVGPGYLWKDGTTTEQQEKFLPFAPDFAIELRFPSDSLTALQAKMREYQENGTRLGWSIDRKNRQVEIYRQGEEKEALENPTTLSGEDVLPRFSLSMESIW